MLAGRLSLAEAERLPRWRRPEACLVVMAAGMPFAFAVWMALINNFVVEAAAFDGSDIGWIHTVREIPGFLAHRCTCPARLHPRADAGNRVSAFAWRSGRGNGILSNFLGHLHYDDHRFDRVPTTTRW